MSPPVVINEYHNTLQEVVVTIPDQLAGHMRFFLKK